MASLRDALPPTCEVTIPSPDDSVEVVLGDRWMQLADSSPPAAVVTPSTEEDIVAVVRHAAAQGLKVVPAGGHLAAFVVSDSRTIYLDMKNFSQVQIDAQQRTVTVGGGTRWGAVMKEVIPLGFYTVWTHFSQIGVVGSVLGGGINTFIGLHGYACDQVVSARVITASGEVLVISSTSNKPLFDLLRGGGYGLCVVTALTLRLFDPAPLSLQDGDKVINYAAIFPLEHRHFITDLYTRLVPVSDRRLAGVSLAILPSLPGMVDGPALAVSVEFVGNTSEAELALVPLLSEEVKQRAVTVQMVPTALSNINDRADGRFARQEKGTCMDVFNAKMEAISAERLSAALQLWCDFNDELGAGVVAKTAAIVASFPAVGPVEADPEGETSMCFRERGVMGQFVLLGLESDLIEPVKKFATEWLDALRGGKAAETPAVYAANMRVGTSIEHVYTAEKLAELKAVKKLWDPEGVFWSPAVDGWP